MTAPEWPAAAGYRSVGKLLAAGSSVLLDGPIETELRRSAVALPGENHRTTLSPGSALVPVDDLAAAHRRHVESGCDVIRTYTAALPPTGASRYPDAAPVPWVDLARERIEAARGAAAGTSTAVAYTLGPQVDDPGSAELVRALDRLFRKEPADLVLVETLSVIRPSLFAAVSQLRSLGLPIWLSFRRCRDGLCGPSGHHWSGDEPDQFGSAARQLEQMGVSALLVNCIPPDHVPGTIEYLRYFTDVPLGVCANLERGFEPGAFAPDGPPAAYDELALQWRAEGAQIVGGCCGVEPQHLWATRGRLSAAGPKDPPTRRSLTERDEAKDAIRPWASVSGRQLFPLPFPVLSRDQGVPAPTVGGLLLWEYLYREGSGANQRCLDVGSGSGLLAVQLALNGATHVHSIDSSAAAVRSTMHSAFRNDVNSAVTAEAADVTTWQPREHYEVVVASLEQGATDPFQQDPGVRDFDPWGRRLIDAFLAKLPALLGRDGVAYLTQSSLISQQQTAETLAAVGLVATIVDWRLWPAAVPQGARSHREMIEQRSDAFHLDIGPRGEHDELIVVYLLEIRRRG